jgi:hypothetical protein
VRWDVLVAWSAAVVGCSGWLRGCARARELVWLAPCWAGVSWA